jgi:hypothetical protein
MTKTRSYAIIAVLIGAALMALAAYVSIAPVDLTKAWAVGIVDLRTLGFVLGLGAFVFGTVAGLLGK